MKQVNGEAGTLETLSSGKVVAKKNGYVYVYTSNESQQDVLFDNFGVEQINGPVLEETHYYPFGLTMAGISSIAPLKLANNYKYNSKELNHKEFSDGAGLDWYSYGMREFDPQIGRWGVKDPFSNKYDFASPYNYVLNNPISSIDPNGGWLFHLFGSTSEQRQSARSVADATGGDVGDFFTKKIHVDYSTSDQEINIFSGEIRNVFTKHTVAFRASGHIDYHSEMLNYIADQDIEWGKNHIIDQNGNVHYIPASGGIRSVPVFSLLVPVPPVLKILGAGRAAEMSAEGATVFRAVDATEAAIIKNTREFSLQQGGLEVKYFAKSLEDAHWYGQRLYPKGYSIIQGTVKNPINPTHYWFPNVDIGAYIIPKETLPYIIPH